MRYLLHLHPDLTIVFQYYLERTYMKYMERIYHGKTNREKQDLKRKKVLDVYRIPPYLYKAINKGLFEKESEQADADKGYQSVYAHIQQRNILANNIYEKRRSCKAADNAIYTREVVTAVKEPPQLAVSACDEHTAAAGENAYDKAYEHIRAADIPAYE